VKAAVIGAARAVTVADTERPVPAVGEVLIDARQCGICGSGPHVPGMPADLRRARARPRIHRGGRR
jgi:D-arabinose 1-dehydrogenase-like Zn-dependent alcohol dehydrogenase